MEAPSEPGLCRVVGPRGFLAWAFFNPRSQIALRAFAFEDQEPLAALKERFERAFHRRRSALEREPQGGFRLVHAEGDFLPGLIVDYYAGYLVVQVLSAVLEALRPLWVPWLQELPVRGVLARNDPPTRLQEGLPREVGVLFGAVPEEIWVEEGSIRYVVNPWQGQKTGAFLDQRENRLRLESLQGERALDVFSYQGGFALHLRGFREVVAVDSSRPALLRAERNAQANQFELRTVEANAFEFLREESRSGARWDLVVLDPPALAKGKSELARAYAAYKELNLRALRLLRPGGWLATASCSHHLSPELFEAMLQEAAADAHRSLRVEFWGGQGWDHPVLLNVPETRYLKFALLEVS